MINSISNRINSYELWLDNYEVQFQLNIDAELDAMASYFAGE